MSPRTRSKRERILGLDPGIARTGFAVVERHGSDTHALVYGCMETPARMQDGDRLLLLRRELDALLTRMPVDRVAIEKLYFSKNVTSALAVGQARGILLAACAERRLPVKEFAPQAVKMSVTGYGAATKQQVQRMVQTLLKLRTLPKPDDAADALALALTAAHHHAHL